MIEGLAALVSENLSENFNYSAIEMESVHSFCFLIIVTIFL